MFVVEKKKGCPYIFKWQTDHLDISDRKSYTSEGKDREQRHFRPQRTFHKEDEHSVSSTPQNTSL